MISVRLIGAMLALLVGAAGCAMQRADTRNPAPAAAPVLPDPAQIFNDAPESP
jgi:hypothetical protein